MPGFNIDSFSGTAPGARLESLRSNRWRITNGFLNGKEWIYLKTASRPKLTFDEMTMYHRIERAYFPGRLYWGSIHCEFYDVLDSQGKAVSSRLMEWTIGPDDKSILNKLTSRSTKSYKGTDVVLEMLDGSGKEIETWKLHNALPLNVDWGKLDHQRSDIMLVSFDLRFDRAVLESKDGGSKKKSPAAARGAGQLGSGRGNFT